MITAKLITNELLEIDYHNEVPGKCPVLRILKDGVELPFSREAFFDQRLTLRLGEKIQKPEAVCLKIELADHSMLSALWEPWYTFREELASDATAVRKNQGTKSKLWVLGNKTSGCPAANPRYTAEYVIQYCTEGINKIAGRSDFLTLAAARNGLKVVIVGDGVSVYEVPEYRHLYRAEDAMTRVTIPGSRELPIIVTTARDVMRQKEKNNNTFELIYVFAKLYWELGVKDGTPMFALSVYDDADTYNYAGHVEAAYAHAKAENLWPGTRMMESVEEYFAYGSMVWYMAMEESKDGQWEYEHFPVNTRCELLAYDDMLHGALVEIYGEFEYFSGYREQHTVNTDSALRVDFPWYKHNQVDNYGIDGKPYAPLVVEECNLISANQIELIFNREVRDLDELRDPNLWKITWIDGSGVCREYTGEQILCENYQWKTLTLMVEGVKMYTGYIGSDVTGFTRGEMREAFDPEAPGYKPWFSENAYERTLDGSLVSPAVYEQMAAEGRSGMEIAPKIMPVHERGSIPKGMYVNFADASTVPDYLKGGIDGSITVTYAGCAADWADHALSTESMSVRFRPWLAQVMRSKKTGVYVYGDPFVQKSSLELACEYWDLFLSNETNSLGQRIADGLAYAGGGAEIMSYHHHAYQMSGQRATYDEQNHFYLYVEGFGGGICQTSEANVVRNYTYTRYDNEFILGHEGGHSIEITGMPCFTDLNYMVEDAYQKAVVEKDLWNHGGLCYAGSDRAEYFATLTNIWHSTMRESTDGSNNGTWLAINTREELYHYDRIGYELMKKIYYNGHPGVDVEKVNRDLAAGVIHLQDVYGCPLASIKEDTILPGFDAEGNSINDDVIRWGSSFPADLMKKLDQRFSEKYGEGTYLRWVSWSVANQWDINDSHDPGSGIRYGEHEKARYGQINYNPYLP